ncbi:Tat (twin-arginine translocation) pathway signal sequence domain protein [Burkholderia thailandensis MSMB121]|uniref:metallophosphoesterase family protein n=1 Tax=Burkholderia humptydooensis TaxID=430531 RepID=UPI0003280EBA|nr:metallophosphoesterase [Burkholderia humptydooensis]AGK47776.1 Tat (twin-arginine translocation) pathway signal sequence domain protein [Burkholderia thailandensis MSMB121]ATF36737.1 serine/threonine protein phosphatase [Burkholderia thailandensis]KST74111.1 serine/threonine protein phosphatase [Burkholderia humptydooensis]
MPNSSRSLKRRDFLRLAACGGGVAFASALPGWSFAANAGADFFFVQLSDAHWGFTGPAINPDARGTLPKTIDAVNALPVAPDFVMFTGDLTHTTDDPAERRARLRQFQSIVAQLNAKPLHLMPGEHDASLDAGAAYREIFGDTHYAFDHKGVHFVVVDNVSDPAGRVGDAQIEWLAQDLARQPKDARIVVFTHRPLFDLAPQWDWATRDGAKVVDVLMPYPNVTVFYGHIHQEHHAMTGHIAHHAARSLMFPLPAPGSQDKRLPVPWDAAAPYRRLGWREVRVGDAARAPVLTEMPVGAKQTQPAA